MEFYDFPYIGSVIIPTDELIFFRGVGIPPTSSHMKQISADVDMGVSINLINGRTPKSSIYRWIFHEINHPAIGVPPF